ncbi:MAG TPA: hypothetical protein VHG71_04455 [Verrucomicrobiae bacterium]|nr:hypothetical protein [Verrucomicrobiae bacterium]
MNNVIQDGPVREIFRPTLFRGSKTTLFYFLIFIGGIYLIIESILLINFWNNSKSLFFICSFVPLIVIVVLSFYSRYAWSVSVYDEKLVVKDYSLDLLLRIPFRLFQIPIQQEILFSEIDFIFYLEKEYNLLLNYRHKLGKYKIARREMDYRREHLMRKYAVPANIIDAFEQSSNKALDDYTATGILMAVEEILDRHKVQENEKKQILKDLKQNGEFSFEHVSRLLSPHAIDQNDLDSLKDLFLDLDTNVLTPFLITKLAIAQLERRRRVRGGAIVAARMNVVLILSDQNSFKKIYLKKFHQLSRADWQKLIHLINERKPGIKYLMPKLNYRNISDPDFKPGCG